MRILHIGDFHFKTKGNRYEQNLMIEKMIENLKTKPKIDLVLFSGDLVFSGSDYKDFENAHIFLFKKISDELHVPMSSIFVCQGNHDINREECSNAVITYFNEKITDNDLLNREHLNNSNDYKLSLKPSKHFVTYLKNYFSSNFTQLNDLCCIGNKEIEGKKVSIVTLNTAWLSSGFRPDQNSLMLPIILLKNAILNIAEADCKIVMLHHPLSYLKEFNSIELEDLIHKEFNLMFSGHIHREQIITKFAGNNGIYSNTTQAALTFDKGGQIGYSLVSYDFQDLSGTIIIDRASYILKEHSFVDSPSVYVRVPCGQEKENQNRLRRKITSKFRSELNNANELLLEYDEESGLNFLDSFTKPVITSNSDSDNVESEKISFYNYENFYSDEKNYVVFGKDKCGKTSLLKRIQLYFLKNFSDLGIVPYYVDYKELESKTSPIDLRKLIRNYYELFNSDVEGIIKEGKLLLLIDNLNTSSPVNEVIISFLATNPNNRFLISSDYLATRVYFEELDNLAYEKLYFKDLSRREIRLYTEKNPSIKAVNKEDAIERVSKLCQQLQLPVNYWTISLILLIYKKSNDDYNKNLFGILDLCVDEILQKRQLLLLKSKLSFEQYKELCSQIAYFLLTEYKKDVYSCSSLELINHIDKLIKENPRIVGDAKEIFDYLLDAGILKERYAKYTFRLNGLFEYFLAYYIHQHPQFKDEILKDDNIYLSFKNELEIYSGFNRRDEDFLRKIFDKTKNVFDKIISRYAEFGSLDQTLMQKLGKAQEIAEKINSLRVSNPLSHEIQDAVRDIIEPIETESDVHLKEFIDANNLTPEVLEKYLNIISRVFKNSDNIQNLELIYSIFEYLLEAYTNFGYYLIDEFSNLNKNEKGQYTYIENKSEIFIGEQLMKILLNFIPILTQVLLYDGIGHQNLVNIVKKYIDIYKQDHKHNQYKLFLLYFLLLDVDLKGNKKLVDEVFENITLGPLKVSTYFKLTFYFAFKAYQNKDLENFFKQKVQEAKFRIDNKTDAGKLNKFLSGKQKRNIVRKHRNK